MAKTIYFFAFFDDLDLKNQKILWLPSIFQFERTGTNLNHPSLVTDNGNILLYLLIHHQTKHMKSNKYAIYIEICIYAKSPHPNSVFCLNLEFFYHFPPCRMVESPPD